MPRSIRFHETGGPEVMKIEDHDVGKPQAGEVRVRMEAIGLNRAEAMFRSGAYMEDPDLPAGLGYEGSAVIDSVGDNVAGFAPGDSVCVIPCFSMNAYPVYAEEAIVPARALIKRPAGLDAVHAAAVWMPYLTAYGALIDIGGLDAGQHVLITAASSSVGLAAIQIANSVGAVPIATTRTGAKADALREAGASHVIVTDEQDIASELMRITDDKGADMAFDPVAGSWVNAIVQGLAPNATLFLYGLLSGEDTPFPLGPALQKGLNLRGYALFEVTGDDDRFEQAKTFVTDGLEKGTFTPTVSRTFPFEQIVDAHRYMESNQQIGKIVVTV